MMAGPLDDDPQHARQEIGHLLRKYRAKAGMTQEQLALTAGTGPETIAQIESGRGYLPRAATERVPAALDLSPSEMNHWYNVVLAAILDERSKSRNASPSSPPIVTGLREAVVEVARADPANIQEVAASQLNLINKYYDVVLKQARHSFYAALVIASVGFIFLAGAIAIALARQSANGPTIGAIGGALAEFIAAVNFYLYGRASSQLASFHARLDQTQRYLIANSICENLEGAIKHTTRADLVAVIAKTPTAIAKENTDDTKAKTAKG